MMNYYADFLEDFATYAEPLRKLTRKNENFKWDENCKTSFEVLKKMAGDKLKVHLFDPNGETIGCLRSKGTISNWNNSTNIRP